MNIYRSQLSLSTADWSWEYLEKADKIGARHLAEHEALGESLRCRRSPLMVRHLNGKCLMTLTISANSSSRTQKASFSTFSSVAGTPSLAHLSPQTISEPSLSMMRMWPTCTRPSRLRTAARERRTSGLHVKEPMKLRAASKEWATTAMGGGSSAPAQANSYNRCTAIMNLRITTASQDRKSSCFRFSRLN